MTRPGPKPAAIPKRWQPWIEAFMGELNAAHRRPQTIRLRIASLITFARATPGSDPLTVTRGMLLAYLGGSGWAASTAHSKRATFRVFFGFLHDRGHRGDDPSVSLPGISVPRSLPRPCPELAICDALASPDVRVRLAIRLAAEAGLRRAEIAHLATTDILGGPGSYVLHVADGKGGHQRLVPIGDGLAADVLSIRRRYVFAGWDGKPISAAYLGRLISRALPGSWAAHSLRHRYATTAYAASRDLRAVQELLGHTSPTTTAIYTAVSDASLRAAAAAAALV